MSDNLQRFLETRVKRCTQRETSVSHHAIILNGELHSPSSPQNEIIIQNNIDNNITITPLSNTKLTLYFINDGARSFKQTITVNFHEPNAEVSLFGLYHLRDKQSVEINIIMNHAVPHCSSQQLWKGVLHDSAKALFEGKIVVSPHAQKTIAHLSNKNLLLSKTAEIATRPFLEIDANDVICTHGATVGCLDEDALFYLRARGIPENEARELLIEAFVNEILDLAR